MEKYFKVKDICQMLKIGKSQAYNLINKGDLPAYKIGNTIRVSEKDFNIYLKQNKY